MLEKAARALAITDGKDPDAPAWIRFPGGETFGVCWRHQYLDKARTVVEAIRDPSPEILEAMVRASGGWVEPYKAPRESGVPVECDISDEDAAFINGEAMKTASKEFNAALDAILREKPE